MPIPADPTGRAAGRRTLRIRGAVAAVVLAVVGTLLYQLAAGRYDDTFRLTVITDTIGEGLLPGAEVKFHGLDIGTVTALASAGYNKQRMTVELQGRQAKSLTADTRAQFTSSNVFGTAAVELVSDGRGARLKPNQTLVIPGGVQAASITGILRQGQKLGRILDSPEVNHIIEVLRRHANLTEPVAKSVLDFAKILTDAQTVPFSQTLSVVAGIVNGGDKFVPLIGKVNELLDGLQFLVEPGGSERSNRILSQAGDFLFQIAEIVGRNQHWLLPLIGSIMNVAVPSAYLFGSLAPSYDRLSGLFDRTSTAFPVQNDRVRLQIEVILDTAPGLAAALPSGLAKPEANGGR